jgi:hypothetical protein
MKVKYFQSSTTLLQQINLLPIKCCRSSHQLFWCLLLVFQNILGEKLQCKFSSKQFAKIFVIATIQRFFDLIVVNYVFSY